jgi:hypothetical protein
MLENVPCGCAHDDVEFAGLLNISQRVGNDDV